MNRYRVLVASALTAATLLAGPLFAQERRGHGGPDGRAGGHGFGIPVRALNLTDAQQTQIRAVRDQYGASLRQAEGRLRAARQAQRAAVRTVPVNEGLVRSTSQVVADAETEVAVEQARIYSDVWAVLTPEQQARLEAVQTQRQSSEGRRGRGARAR